MTTANALVKGLEPYPPILTVNARKGHRAAGYGRISEARFGESAGVVEQGRIVGRLALRRDLDLVAWFPDNNKSAMKPGTYRPEFEALLEMVERGELDFILVDRTDRLYRLVKELVASRRMPDGSERPGLTDALKDANVLVYSEKNGDVDLSTADGRMVANIMGSVAQRESEAKGERVTDNARARAQRGRYLGGNRRFGYQHSSTRIVLVTLEDGTIDEVVRPSGPLELVPAEAEAIAWAYSAVLVGVSLEAVAREWRLRELTGPTGARLTATGVRDVLLRPMNAGLAVYKGTELGLASELDPNGVGLPVIVDVETWRTARAILLDPSRKTGRGRPTVTLLGQVLRCAVCLAEPEPDRGGRMSVRRHRAGNRQPIYTCRPSHVHRSQAELDEAMEAVVGRHLVANAAKLRRSVAGARTRGAAAKLERRAEALRGKLAGYQAAAGDMEPADYAAATRAVRAELAELDKRAVQVADRPATLGIVQSEDIAAAWAAAPVEVKRTVIRECVDRILVRRAAPGGPVTAGVKVFWR
jgi:site-specific DNA recombinase